MSPTTTISTTLSTASAADALWCSYALQFHLLLRIARYLWHQNAPPCTNPAKQEAMPSKAWLPVFEPGCRAAAPAGCAEGSAPARSPEAEHSGPRHFAGFRRKTESVIVGSYTFAESAVPPSPRAPNATYNTHPRKEAIPWQEMTAWTAPPSATSPEPKAISPTLKPTMSVRKPATGTRILSPNAVI